MPDRQDSVSGSRNSGYTNNPPQPGKSDWPIWGDPKDSKAPPLKKGTYDWGYPYGKGNLK